MADLDKTIKSLQYHLEAEDCCSCVRDAVELLKELKERRKEIEDLRQTCQSMMEGIVVSSK